MSDAADQTRDEKTPQTYPALPADNSKRPGRLRALLRRAATLIVAAALALLGWQSWDTRSRLDTLQEELARRLSEGDALAREGHTLAKQNQDLLQNLQAKVGALEGKLAESQSQQMALEAMYQELARNRDDRLIAEIDQALNLAAQQLQLAGNVEAALAALQTADARLAAANRPQLLALRKVLNRDMERLRALPVTDVPGMALRLETVIGAVDGLPLAFEANPRAEAASAVGADAGTGLWRRLLKDLWVEMKQLIRVERLDQPDPALLSPSNAFFLRENLKLRLINARLALLARDGKSFHDDIHQAQTWLERFFDARNKQMQSALTTLKQLGSTELNIELPTLNDSLTALRNLKAARDKGAPAVGR